MAKWIQGAIKNPGALRAYVRRVYGKEGFQGGDPSNPIRNNVLQELASKKGTVGKRARLALTLRKM